MLWTSDLIHSAPLQNNHLRRSTTPEASLCRSPWQEGKATRAAASQRHTAARGGHLQLAVHSNLQPAGVGTLPPVNNAKAVPRACGLEAGGSAQHNLHVRQGIYTSANSSSVAA